MKKKLACYNLYKPAGKRAGMALAAAAALRGPAWKKKALAACAAARFWRKTSSARAYQRAFGSFLSIFVPSLWHAFSIEGRCEQSLIETLTFL